MSETLIPAEAASPPPGPATEPAVRLANEERIKNEEHPLNCYHRLVENARKNHPPSKADTFRFKWSGWFYLKVQSRTPLWLDCAFPARMADEVTTGYVQITTRANLLLRMIAPKDTPEFLRPLQGFSLRESCSQRVALGYDWIAPWGC